VFDDLRHRRVREEAQVGRARDRHGRLGLELSARLVEVDLLPTECQGVVAFAEDHGLHTEHPLVEVAGASDVAHGQNEVVEPLDLHRVLLRCIFCHRRRAPFIRVIRTGAIYGSYAALHAIHSSSPECVEGKFSETEELLFALPSPLIYYPLNEQPMRFRIRHLRKD
jgi:hypothetical protein